MQIIASNEDQLKSPLRGHWGFWAKSLVVTSSIVMILTIINIPFAFINYIVVPLFVFLLLSLVLSINGWIKNHPSPFCAYADQGCLYINFETENTSRYHSYNVNRSVTGGEPRNYCFPFKQIMGYKLHVLFKNPTALEIQLDENRPEILNMIIPLNSISKKEAQKLVTFLEQIIPHQTIDQRHRLA